MAASDHLNPQQFFHGSRYSFKPGDVLTPEAGSQHQNFAETDKNYVYATSSKDHAMRFASMADETQARRGGMKDTRPKVYKVAPIGHVEPDEDDGEGWAGELGSVRSKEGFRVIRKQRDIWS